jgi:hypothetical protein
MPRSITIFCPVMLLLCYNRGSQGCDKALDVGDDLIVDEDAGFAYVATHQQNTIERITLESGVRRSVAGEPPNLDMIGSAGSRRRQSGIFLDRWLHQESLERCH